MLQSNYRPSHRVVLIQKSRLSNKSHLPEKFRRLQVQVHPAIRKITPEDTIASAKVVRNTRLKCLKRRKLLRLAASRVEVLNKYRNERHTRQGPLCYAVSITLLSIRSLLKTLHRHPGNIDAEQIESVTPLLERLESTLQTCGSCPLLDNATARICH